jgi:hypothetical protein
VSSLQKNECIYYFILSIGFLLMAETTMSLNLFTIYATSLCAHEVKCGYKMLYNIISGRNVVQKKKKVEYNGKKIFVETTNGS